MSGNHDTGIRDHSTPFQSICQSSDRPNKVDTDAPRTFKRTGVNAYLGQETALSEGKTLYRTRCAACHLPDGTGRIGPSLVDDEQLYERVATDVGRFEVVYGSASGAMTPFAQQGLGQDQILKIIAHVRSLNRP